MPGFNTTSSGKLIADLEEAKAEAETFSKPADGTIVGDDEVKIWCKSCGFVEGV